MGPSSRPRTNTWLWYAACAGVLAVATLGCKDDHSDSKPATKPLVDEAETAAAEAAFLAEVAANQTRQCTRPVLRGEPTPGSASEDMQAVLAGSPDTAACRTALEEASQLLHRSLYDADPAAADGAVTWPERTGNTVRAASAAPSAAGDDNSDDDSDQQAIQALITTCEPLVARIQQAVQHGDACSPYLPGVRGQHTDVSLLASIQILALTARAHFARGELERGASLALDGVRFAHDVMRGGASILSVVVASHSLDAVIGVLETQLNQPQPFGDATLARIDRELATLIGTTPHPRSYLRGELQHTQLYGLLPQAKGPEWTPPGGWGPAPRAPAPAANDDDAEAGAWIPFLSMKALAETILAGCRDDEAPSRCRAHVIAEQRRLAAAAGERDELVAALATGAADDDTRARAQDQIGVVLQQVMVSSFDRYIHSEGAHRFRLAALRMHVAYRRRAEAEGSCPDSAMLAADDLKALRVDPYSDEAIQPNALDPQHIVLWRPSAASEPTSSGQRAAAFIRCPIESTP